MNWELTSNPVKTIDDSAAAAAPILVATGFLGAGKTTLLRQLLPLLEARKLRPFVILNDYENAEVDASRLKHLAKTIEPISGSCICCDSLGQLDQVLVDLQPEPRQVVLIEANGTTDPEVLIEHLSISRRLRGRYGPLMNAVVIHLGAWQRRETGEQNELERLQARVATHVVGSHEFGVDHIRRDAVVAEVARVGSSITASADDLADLLVDCVEHPDVARGDNRAWSVGETAGGHHRNSAHNHPHHKVHSDRHSLAHQFMSCEIPLPSMVDGGRLLEWLRSLPREILRVKGLACLTQFSNLHFVFQRTSTEPGNPTVFPIPIAPSAPPCAVCIGTGFDENAVRKSAEIMFDEPTD